MNDFHFLKLLFNIFNKINLESNFDESDQLYENYKERENILSDFMNDFLLNKRNILWNENGQLKIPASIFVEKFIEIMKEYLNYTQLDYFSIPVIGKISSGKSTFLNSLLGLDCLESDTIITTKFICIIRHNRELSAPKLFPVILKKRKSEINPNAYNFVKDEKNELKGDLKEKIHEINQKLSKCEELKNLKKEEFFYILEANLDIFKGRNYIYSKMFEFMDLPGLNEITEFYLKNIIPLITPNTHFSIFLFDAGASEDQGTLKLFKNFLHLMNSKAKKNSFFIYNKLDIFNKDISEESKQILYFKNEILFKTYKIKLKNNHLVGLDSIQLKYDKNKSENFSDYIKSYIQSIPEKKTKKFENLFKKKIKEDFQIKKFPKMEDKNKENSSEEDKKLLNEINNLLQIKTYDEIDISFLIQMKNIYNEKKNNNNSQIKENIKNGSEKYDDIYDKFNKSFKDTVDDFVGKNNLLLLLKAYNTLLIRFYEISQNQTEIEHIKHVIYHFYYHWGNTLYPKMIISKNKDLLDSSFNLYRFMNFEFEIKSIFDWNIESIGSLNPYLNSLKQFNSNLINKVITNIENVLNYFNNRKLRLAFIGNEFSGKTSILNQIINNDLLPLHEKGKDSDINIIFQYNNNNEIKLFSAKIRMIDNYFYFEKNNKPIATGIIDVKNKLIELKNIKADFENSFYILIAPTYPIINFKLIEDISDKIEIIYLSGKYLRDLEFGKNKNLEALIKCIDNFIYIEKEEDISENSFQYLKKIIFFISTINNSFNLNKFLYIINRCSKNDKNFEKIINSIKNILPKVCWFSIEDYKQFLNINNLIQDDKIFFTQIIKNIKSKKSQNSKNNFDLITEINNEVNLLLKFVNSNSQDFIIRLFFNFMKDYLLAKDEIIISNLKQILLNEGISEEEFNKNNQKIYIIVDCFCHLKNEVYQHITFYNSNAKIFFSELFNLIFDMKFYLDYDLKITTENTKDYLKSIFKLINEKLTETNNKNPKYFFSDDSEKNKIKENFEKYFNEYKKNFSDKLEQYKVKYILKIENIYKSKLNNANNIDIMMENEEEIYFNSLTNDLSKYYNSFNNFKKCNQLNDLLFYSQLFLNDYNRSNIDNDSIKTEFKFGWFFLYNIKNKIKKYEQPKSINYMYKNTNLKEQECKNYYEFKFNGFKYFIDCVLKDIYLDMKNNLSHIIDFKLENFSIIKENSDKFDEICINLFDFFDDNDDEEPKNKS